MATPARTRTTTTSRRTTAKGTQPRGKAKKQIIFVDGDGDEFELTGKINSFLLLKLQADQEDGEFNGGDIYRFIRGMLTLKDRDRFVSKMSRHADMDAKRLNDTMEKMLKVVSGENPTDSSSGSARTAKRSTSRALSAAN